MLGGSMVPVARRNLFSEKGRFVISTGGVAFAVLLVLVVLALYRGFSRTGETFELLPGELWLTQEGTTDPFHSLSLLRPEQVKATESVSGVDAVVPVLIRQMSFETGSHEASARLMALGVPVTVPIPDDLRKRYVPPPGTMIIDSILSEKEDIGAGSQVRIGSVVLTVGEVQPRSAEAFEPFAFINFADARAAFGVGDVVNFAMLDVTSGANTTAVTEAIKQRVDGTEVFTREEFGRAIRKEIDESFLPIIGILLAIGFVVGAAVVGLTIYTATIERSREFGVMKAVGASGTFLYRIVATQSAWLTASGFIFGLLAALVVAELARSAVPDFATDFRPEDVASVLAGTVLMAIVGSLIPVRRLNGIDPALVFRA
jgi:putative ABC transport system permease protein